MHLENLNYDISLYCSAEFQATCAHSVWRYAFEIAFWSVREIIITRNVYAAGGNATDWIDLKWIFKILATFLVTHKYT